MDNTYAYFGGAIIISGVAMILINKKNAFDIDLKFIGIININTKCVGISSGEVDYEGMESLMVDQKVNFS